MPRQTALEYNPCMILLIVAIDVVYAYKLTGGWHQVNEEQLAQRPQLEGLRLIKAFLRIEDADQRASIIHFAERLMHETHVQPAAASPRLRTDGPGGSSDDIQD